MILHVSVCPEREYEPDKVETQNHVNSHYGPDALFVAEPTAAHALTKVKIFVSLVLSLQVTKISTLIL